MSSLKKTGKWWVLAKGDPFGEAGFEGRDLCRAKLLRQVNDAGIKLDENVWVYDEDECALLVISVCEDADAAEESARVLAQTGLEIKVSSEFE